MANLTVLEEYISLFVFISGQMHLLATITAIPQSPYIKKKKQGKNVYQSLNDTGYSSNTLLGPWKYYDHG